MNSLNVVQTDGGIQLKQGDFGSRLAFQLVDEKHQAMPELEGQEAVVKLGKVWRTTTKVENGEVAFHLDAVLPRGGHVLEVVVGDYVFPSDRNTKVTIIPSETKYSPSQLHDQEKAERKAFATLANRVTELEEKQDQDTVYDDSALVQRVQVLETAVTGNDYQTKAQVDANITGRDYVTSAALTPYVQSTVFDEYKTEVRQRLTEISTEILNQIPRLLSSEGVNRIERSLRMSGTGWSQNGANWTVTETHRNQPVFRWVSGNKVTPSYEYTVTPGETYTFSCYVQKENVGNVYLYLFDGNSFLNVPRENIYRAADTNFFKLTKTFTATANGTLSIRLAMMQSETGGFKHTPFMLEYGTDATEWPGSSLDQRLSELRASL